MTDDQIVQTTETKPPKASFFSIPGDPSIPALVRAYGTFIRLANAIAIVVAAGAMLLLLIELGNQSGGRTGISQVDAQINAMRARESAALGVLFFACIIQIIVSSILFSVGKLVRNGHKTGIHAVTALAILEIIGGVILAALAKQGGATISIVTFVAVAIVLGPPIVVAYKNWEKFH